MRDRLFSLLIIFLVVYAFFLTFNDSEQYPQEFSRNVLSVGKPAPKQYFGFYQTERDKEFKEKKLPTPESAYLLSAFEFPNEISIVHTNRDITGATLWCRYFDENSTEISFPQKSFTFPIYLVNCPKVPGTQRVSLSVFENSTDFDFPIPLVQRDEVDYGAEKYEFSMCVSPIYGKEPKWLMISELIEHYKLQGVSHFYFYIHLIDQYSRAILEEYQKTGEITVVNLLEKYDRGVSDWQIVQYRDCQLRAKFESRWALFADLDERILMTGYPGTILNYLRDLKNAQNIGAVVFRQRWILKTETMPEKYVNDSHLLSWLPTLRWHNTSSVGPPGHTVKTIADPRKVYEAWVHYPKRYYPGQHESHDVKPEDGYVRHYRDQKMGNWGKTWINDVITFGPFSLTNYSEIYQEKLVENVRKRVENVYKNYNLKLED
ncbi:unnamed protein product [Caenorhabditis angaria]|uniref:Glycosyltransferase family 92 protein n=1 Tax=Caenorhabditis angaria TaxID=860376 RepID=A0A9P1IQP4_9PELO|nr:unnamed protein product [Caenorhabditis angaria]